MSIKIVAGPMCAGKSTFIKKNFPNHTVVDLYDFQDGIIGTYADVMRSYEECRDELVKAIQRGDDVVLEHTLLKQCRRPMYIDAIRSVTDEDIEMYFILPSIDEHIKYAQARNIGADKQYLEGIRSIIELPTIEEGYSAVHLIVDGYSIDATREDDESR